jgi:hypothetical protein
VFSEKWNQHWKKNKIGKSLTPMGRTSIVLWLGKPHQRTIEIMPSSVGDFYILKSRVIEWLKSYPRVLEICLSCDLPIVRFYISSAEDYTNMTYYNLSDIGSKHSNFTNNGGYQILFSIRNPYINRFTYHFSIHS